MGLKTFYQKGKVEVGCDEAGRGCLAGPVYAAAVILNANKRNSQLDDSKKISHKKRIQLRNWIEKHALAWAVGIVSPQEIDEINILNASFLAMHRALEQLAIDFDHILVDGNRFTPYPNKTHFCIIKGDSKYKSIAAASILAKTHRDDKMIALGKDYPNYNWSANKGYPSKSHREAIVNFGSCEHHRKSFNLIPKQTQLSFD